MTTDEATDHATDETTRYDLSVVISTHSRPEQLREAEASRAAYQPVLSANRYGEITTEIVEAPEFYFAEGYHQQYLAKNPNGYCGLGGTGVACPVGLVATD